MNNENSNIIASGRLVEQLRLSHAFLLKTYLRQLESYKYFKRKNTNEHLTDFFRLFD